MVWGTMEGEGEASRLDDSELKPGSVVTTFMSPLPSIGAVMGE